MVKNSALPVAALLQSRGRLLDLSGPVVMAILNATPDSFYNKGAGSSPDALTEAAGQALEAGAVILDIGGVSTRPGAPDVPPEEELGRIIPAIEAVRRAFPHCWISVDTWRSSVAEAAVAAGADLINDVSAGTLDGDMIRTVAALGVPYIAMHMQGTPKTMQQDPQYGDVVTEVFDYLREKAQACEAGGIKDIIIDPGFGFGKTLEHNFALLGSLHAFRAIGKPVLAGISRKSMICRALGVKPADALNGTTALHMVALQQGASILRAHDVKEAVETIRLWEWTNRY